MPSRVCAESFDQVALLETLRLTSAHGEGTSYEKVVGSIPTGSTVLLARQASASTTHVKGGQGAVTS